MEAKFAEQESAPELSHKLAALKSLIDHPDTPDAEKFAAKRAWKRITGGYYDESAYYPGAVGPMEEPVPPPPSQDPQFFHEYEVEGDQLYQDQKPYWTNWEAYGLWVNEPNDPEFEGNDDWIEWKTWERGYQQWKQSRGEVLPQFPGPDIHPYGYASGPPSKSEMDQITLLMRAVVYTRDRTEAIHGEAAEADLRINTDGSYHRGSRIGQKLNAELEELSNNEEVALAEIDNIRRVVRARHEAAAEAAAASVRAQRQKEKWAAVWAILILLAIFGLLSWIVSHSLGQSIVSVPAPATSVADINHGHANVYDGPKVIIPLTVTPKPQYSPSSAIQPTYRAAPNVVPRRSEDMVNARGAVYHRIYCATGLQSWFTLDPIIPQRVAAEAVSRCGSQFWVEKP